MEATKLHIDLNDTLTTSSEHALTCTEGSSIKFEYPEYINYPPGLYKVMELIYERLKNVNVTFQHLQFWAVDPEISFQIADGPDAINVWKAMYSLRVQATFVCHRCGKFGRKQCSRGVVAMLCPECLENYPSIGFTTGTWLDRY